MLTVYEVPNKLVFGCYSDMTGIDFLVMVKAGDFEKAKEIAQTELEKWSTGEPEDYENLGYIECVQNALEKEDIYATFYDEVTLDLRNRRKELNERTRQIMAKYRDKNPLYVRLEEYKQYRIEKAKKILGLY